jgi:predicted ATPase
VEAFRPLFDALAGMGFYSINPDPIREIHPHDRGELLDRSGRNLAAVIKRLSEEKPHVVARIEEYLRQIVPGIEAVDHVSFGPRETLGFRQTVQRNKPPWRFYASSMSDGTLRSLGVLTALFQFSANSDKIIPFIAIEEPESTIHPGGANILMDAILEASQTQQILVTTHSPDLLDHVALINSNILGVQKIANDTVIGPVNEASMSAIRDGLYTPGELLRQGQLPPEPKKTIENLRQSDLFEAM